MSSCLLICSLKSVSGILFSQKTTYAILRVLILICRLISEQDQRHRLYSSCSGKSVEFLSQIPKCSNESSIKMKENLNFLGGSGSIKTTNVTKFLDEKRTYHNLSVRAMWHQSHQGAESAPPCHEHLQTDTGDSSGLHSTVFYDENKVYFPDFPTSY